MDFGTIDPVMLRRVVPLRRRKRQLNREQLPSVEEITDLSQDVLKKRYAKYIRKINEKCNGMQLGHALAIADGKL
jgi:hypothetical protein